MYHKGLYLYEKKKHETCSKATTSCKLLKSFKDSSSCSRCLSKIVLVPSGSGTYRHTGPVNDKLRAILPLQVNGSPMISIAGNTLLLEENKWLVIDDSFENSVQNDSQGDLLLLIVDFNHPDLTDKEKKASYSLNEFMKNKFVIH